MHSRRTFFLVALVCALLAGATQNAQAGQITASNVPLGDVTVGVDALGVEVQRITLSTSASEDGNLSSLTFKVSGSAGLDVTTAHLVRDPAGAATPLSSVSGPFFDTWTIDFNGLTETIGTGTSTYALRVDFDGNLQSGGAGMTLRTDLTALHATGVLSTTTMTEVGMPAAGDRDVSVQETIDGVVQLSDPGQLVDAGVAAGSVDVEIHRFELQVTQDSGTLQALSVGLSGSGDLGDLLAAELIFDANANGLLDDAVIDSDTALADASADFSGLSQPLAEDVIRRLFVRVDIAPAPVVGGNYSASLAAADVHIDGGVSPGSLTVGGGPVAGRTLTLDSGEVAITSASLPSVTVPAYEPSVEAQRVTLSTPPGVSGSVSSLDFKLMGGATQDLAKVSLFRDPGVFAVNVANATGPFVDGQTLTFDGLTWTGDLDGEWSVELDFNAPTSPGEKVRTELSSVNAVSQGSGTPLTQTGTPALSSRSVQLGDAPPEVPVLPVPALFGLALLGALLYGLRRV